MLYVLRKPRGNDCPISQHDPFIKSFDLVHTLHLQIAAASADVLLGTAVVYRHHSVFDVKLLPDPRPCSLLGAAIRKVLSVLVAYQVSLVVRRDAL